MPPNWAQTFVIAGGSNQAPAAESKAQAPAWKNGGAVMASKAEYHRAQAAECERRARKRNPSGGDRAQLLQIAADHIRRAEAMEAAEKLNLPIESQKSA
jgi:transcription elongation factor